MSTMFLIDRFGVISLLLCIFPQFEHKAFDTKHFKHIVIEHDIITGSSNSE